MELSLRVSDMESLELLRSDGAQFVVSLNDSNGEELVSVDEVAIADEDDISYVLQFRPPANDRERIRRRIGVRLQKSDADADDVIYSWGSNRFLRQRGDMAGLAFDDRETAQLQGLHDPQRVCSRQHDDHRELMVVDVEQEQTRLVLFRCDEQGCANHGEVELAAEDDEGALFVGSDCIVAPDMIVAPDGGVDEGDSGFLVTYVSQYSGSGEDRQIKELEHLLLRLVEEGDGWTLAEQRATLELPSIEETTWLEQTIAPRIIEDTESGELRAGLSIVGHQHIGDGTRWVHLVIQDDGRHRVHDIPFDIGGLEHEEQEAARHGQVASCSPAGENYQRGLVAPRTALKTFFQTGDLPPRVAIGDTGAIDDGMEVFELSESFAPHATTSRCKVSDLDGDGRPDLAFSVGSDDGRRGLFISHRNEEAPAWSEPELVLHEMIDPRWELFRKEDSLYLSVSRTGRNPQTGKEIKIAAKAELSGTPTITVTNTPPAVAGISVVTWDNVDEMDVLTPKQGNDRVVRKKPGRTTYSNGVDSSDVDGGLFQGAQVIHRPGGAWVSAHFSGGLINGSGGDGEAALRFGDERTIIGWLSSTGPFIPLEAPNGQFGPHTEMVCCFGDEQPFEARVLSLVTDDQGETTGVEILDVALVDGQPKIVENEARGLDYSKVEGASKKKVKFKAGAELSKSVNSVGTEDDESCGDGADFDCPEPSSAKLVFVDSSGKVLVGELTMTKDVTGEIILEEARELVLPGSDSGGDTTGQEALWVGSLGGEPIVALRDATGADGSRHHAVLFADSGAEEAMIARDDGTLLFGDFMGRGHSQVLQARAGGEASGDSNPIRCQTTHLSIGYGDDLETVEQTLDAESQSVCFPEDGDDVSVIDIDGDGCQDLVFADRDVALLSRCDGTFEAELVELRDWAAHLGGDDGWEPRAQNHNSSRSNRTEGLAGDGDDADDEVLVILPFGDGLMRVNDSG